MLSTLRPNERALLRRHRRRRPQEGLPRRRHPRWLRDRGAGSPGDPERGGPLAARPRPLGRRRRRAERRRGERQVLARVRAARRQRGVRDPVHARSRDRPRKRPLRVDRARAGALRGPEARAVARDRGLSDRLLYPLGRSARPANQGGLVAGGPGALRALRRARSAQPGRPRRDRRRPHCRRLPAPTHRSRVRADRDPAAGGEPGQLLR